MKDAVSISRVKVLHPLLREEVALLIGKIEVANPFVIRVVQGLRTFEEQQALYEQGRTKPGHIVTNAKPGSSFHQYGLAIDFAILYDKDANGSYEALSWDINYDFDKDGVKDWQEVVKVFKENGYNWGGDFKSITDNPHLEKSFSLSIKELKQRYQNKDWYMGQTGYVRI